MSNSGKPVPKDTKPASAAPAPSARSGLHDLLASSPLNRLDFEEVGVRSLVRKVEIVGAPARLHARVRVVRVRAFLGVRSSVG